MQRLRAWLRKRFVREVFIAVPMGFDAPLDGKPGEDPRFLREMAESMKRAPVVYENALNMLKDRERTLRAPPPETTEAERLAWRWRQERLLAEAAVLRTILSGPAVCAKALNDLANHRKAVQSEEHSNWTLERTAE
jgi:hypothetical protein